MNFLAHFHLAWPDEMLVVGGLEGDFHKGALPGALPSELLQGVRLHRAIDAFTDSHAEVAGLRRQFPQGLRRYAGILIDLCFDHFLARHWEAHSDISLVEFNRVVYGMLERQQGLLSDRAARMAGWLCSYDMLNHYQHWDTIPASAMRIGERLRGDNPLTETDRHLSELLPELERSFAVFYPDLVDFSQRSISQFFNEMETST